MEKHTKKEHETMSKNLCDYIKTDFKNDQV